MRLRGEKDEKKKEKKKKRENMVNDKITINENINILEIIVK